MTGHIVRRCRKCGGAKHKMVSVKPITFVRCNKCQGRGGKKIAAITLNKPADRLLAL